MSEYELREVLPDSEEYRELLALRFEELRKPLGMTWTPEELEADLGDRHFGLWHNDGWLGVLVVHALDQGEVKLRQIAVTKRLQSQGLGRRLMTLTEEKLRSEGVKACQLNARVTVAGFYEATGYRRVGEVFEEIGIPHTKMRKALTDV